MQARRQLATLLLIALVGTLSGCASTGGSSPATAPTMDPVGEYRFDFVDRGESATGTATISGEPGALTGTVRFDDGRPDTPISAAAASGNLMIVTADIPGAVLVMRLRFEGEAFTGDWVMGRGTGTLSGTRLEVAR